MHTWYNRAHTRTFLVTFIVDDEFYGFQTIPWTCDVKLNDTVEGDEFKITSESIIYIYRKWKNLKVRKVQYTRSNIRNDSRNEIIPPQFLEAAITYSFLFFFSFPSRAFPLEVTQCTS